MKLTELPKEVLVQYIEQSMFQIDDRLLKRLHCEYKREALNKEFDRLKEEADKVKHDIHAWLKIQKCIDSVFDDMTKLTA